MKGTLTTRITIVVLAAAAAAAGALLFVWPLMPPEPPASPRTSAPPPAASPSSAPPNVAAAVEAVKSLTDQVGPRRDPTGRVPRFDVARIEPTGEAVIAGHAAPGATVELLRGGVAHDRTVADRSGDFVLIPGRLPPGNYDLTLRATEPDGRVSSSKDSVAVALRSGGKDTAAPPRVGPVAPEKPAAAPPRLPPGLADVLVIEAVKGQAGGRLDVSGRAAPGAKVRLYLNDAYIASGTASADGRVAFSIRSGIKPGGYRIRLDRVDASGRVLAHAELPFSAPASVAASVSPGPPDSQAVAAAPDTESASATRSIAAARKPDTARAPAAQAAPGPPSRTAAPTMEPSSARPSHSEPRSKTDASGRATASATARSAPPASTAAANGPALTSAPTARRAEPKPRPEPPVSMPRSAAAPPPTIAEPAAPVSPATRAPEAPPAATVPAAAATSPAPAVAAETTTSAAAEDDRTGVVVVPSVQTFVVTRGDNLWKISQSTYGRGARYPLIYDANRDQIRDPDLIYPDQIFVLPRAQPDG